MAKKRSENVVIMWSKDYDKLVEVKVSKQFNSFLNKLKETLEGGTVKDALIMIEQMSALIQKSIDKGG